ncbi:uncharacterized protein LOC144166151 isoform X1 [Haemaphysalis longicornis]
MVNDGQVQPQLRAYSLPQGLHCRGLASVGCCAPGSPYLRPQQLPFVAECCRRAGPQSPKCVGTQRTLLALHSSCTAAHRASWEPHRIGRRLLYGTHTFSQMFMSAP